MADGASSLIELTADIVAAYVANNPVPPTAVADLIASVNRSLAGLGQPKEEPQPELVPAVSVKKSITPDYLVSLEDGRKFQSLKRHLGVLGMTPADYRAKWNLPANYPMTASNYAARRSELAKNIGLGRKKAAEPAEQPAPKKRGRPAKGPNAPPRTNSAPDRHEL